MSNFAVERKDEHLSLDKFEENPKKKNTVENFGKYHQIQEQKRRNAVFESVDVQADIILNIKNKSIKQDQSRLLFVGGIVSQLSFCKPLNR